MSTDGILAELIAKMLSLGINLTDNQKAYLEWRTSEEGKKYFKRKEDNAFYDALARGDTAILDTGIKEKQDMINRLKKELGLLVVLVLMMVPGCNTIPEQAPAVTPNVLKTAENTYTISDSDLKTDQGLKILKGQWHVVSPDFMKDHIRNQDDLIASLERNKKLDKTANLLGSGMAGAIVAAVMLFLVLILTRRKKDG